LHVASDDDNSPLRIRGLRRSEEHKLGIKEGSQANPDAVATTSAVTGAPPLASLHLPFAQEEKEEETKKRVAHTAPAGQSGLTFAQRALVVPASASSSSSSSSSSALASKAPTATPASLQPPLVALKTTVDYAFTLAALTESHSVRLSRKELFLLLDALGHPVTGVGVGISSQCPADYPTALEIPLHGSPEAFHAALLPFLSAGEGRYDRSAQETSAAVDPATLLPLDRCARAQVSTHIPSSFRTVSYRVTYTSPVPSNHLDSLIPPNAFTLTLNLIT
jgi:hypothetical protein